MAKHETLYERDDIERWAKARDAVPAREHGRADPGLRMLFPGQRVPDNVETLEWDTFFEVLSDYKLVMIVQDEGALGTRSRFAAFAPRGS